MTMPDNVKYKVILYSTYSFIKRLQIYKCIAQYEKNISNIALTRTQRGRTNKKPIKQNP